MEEKIKSMQNQAVKFAYAKTIREFERLIKDINWVKDNNIKIV